MQKIFLVLLYLLMSLRGMVQEIGMTAGIGYARVNMKAIGLRKLMLCREFCLVAELPVAKTGYSFSFSAGMKKMEAEFTDLNGVPGYNWKEFVNLPIALKKYYTISKRVDIFLEGGFNAAYFLTDKVELVRNNTVSIHTNNAIGWNVGASTSIRCKILIGNKLYYDVGFAAGKEWSLHAVSRANRIRIDWKMLMNSFSLKLQ